MNDHQMKRTTCWVMFLLLSHVIPAVPSERTDEVDNEAWDVFKSDQSWMDKVSSMAKGCTVKKVAYGVLF